MAIVVAVIVLLLLVAAGVCGYTLYKSAKNVMNDAQTVLALADTLKADVMSGSANVQADAQQITDAADRMQEEVSGPLWDLAELVPTYGSDVVAARDLVGVLDDLSNDALMPLANGLAANPVKDLVADGGTINVAGVQILCNTLGSVAPSIHTANSQIQDLGETHIDQLTTAVEKAKTTFDKLDSYTTLAEGIAPIVPQMLGADSPRYDLIVAENNSEVRATGGFSGASGILSIVDGKISLDSFESAQVLESESESGIVVTGEEFALFQPDGESLSKTSGDSFMTPDFPRGAELTCAIWKTTHPGAQIDGVVALDPIFLQRVLKLTGGVTAVDGTMVDGSNAAKTLLSDVYWKYPTDYDMQDAVFSSVADAAFSKLLGNLGAVNIKSLLSTVQDSMADGRLLVWMANEQEEQLFTSFGAGGQLPTSTENPVTGIYVNNYSYSKLDWYLSMDTQKGEAVHNADGTASYPMTVTLTNTMDPGLVSSLPSYVGASSTFVDSVGQELLGFYLYAPFGGSISDVQPSSGSLSEATHNGLQVFWSLVYLDPGESVTVTYTVTVPAEVADEDLTVRMTPTAQIAREGRV